MTNKIRDLRTLLIQLRSEIFSNDKENALSRIEKNFDSLIDVKDEILISYFFVLHK